MKLKKVARKAAPRKITGKSPVKARAGAQRRGPSAQAFARASSSASFKRVDGATEFDSPGDRPAGGIKRLPAEAAPRPSMTGAPKGFKMAPGAPRPLQLGVDSRVKPPSSSTGFTGGTRKTGSGSFGTGGTRQTGPVSFGTTSSTRKTSR
jgi:hypothetical protein